MNAKSISGIGFVVMLALAGCSTQNSGSNDPNANGGVGGGTGGSGALGGGGATSGAGGSAGVVTGGGGGTAGAQAGTGGGAGSTAASGGTAGIAEAGTGGDAAGAAAGGVAGAGDGGTAGSNLGGAGSGGDAGASGAGAGGAGGVSTAVTVRLDMPKQTMAGFGINNNWAPAMSDADADAMFDVTKGIGLSILRVGMASSGEPFNGASCWQDIQKAKARGVTTFIGTLWTPPASYKTNNNENNGGHLKPANYEQWANTIAAFPAKVKTNAGVDLYAMSPQNEPDFASCGTAEPCNGSYPTTLFTASEMVDFVKVVGPKLRALSPPVLLMAPEASEWLHNWSNESACCSEPGGKQSSDPLMCGFPPTGCAAGAGYDYGHALFADKTAWGLLDIMGVHQYDTQVAEPWPSDVPEKRPVWETEMSGVKWWPEQGPSSDINNAVAVAGWIHNAVTVGEASAWLWWWWKAQGSTNEGLLLSTGGDTKRHYSLGNYSKFVRPGYVHVDVTGAIPTDVLLAAFSGPDGTLVVVAINKGSAAASVPISIAGGMAPAMLTPWVTSASDNLVSKAAIAVTDGTFTAALPATTVTTFVGK